jgi:hypothetical protein
VKLSDAVVKLSDSPKKPSLLDAALLEMVTPQGAPPEMRLPSWVGSAEDTCGGAGKRCGEMKSQ